MDDQHGHSAEGDLDLDGAIDDLLGEIDSAVAEKIETTPKSPEADAAPSNKPAEPDGAKPEDMPEDKVKDDHGDEALRTIDAIEESADALLDDALDTLLDDNPSAQSEPETVDAAESESVSEPEIPAEAKADTKPEIQTEDPIPDDLDAAIDELIEAPVPTEQAIDEATTEPIVENDPVMAVNRPAEEPPEQQPGNLAEEIDNAVDDILNEDNIVKEPEPAAQVVAPEPTVPEPTENLGIIEDLDDALAAAANDLLDGDFENAEGDLVEATTVDYAVDPSLLLDKDEPDPEPQPGAETTSETAAEPAAETTAEPAADTPTPEPAAGEETTEPVAVNQESIPEAAADSAPVQATPPAPATPAPTPAAPVAASPTPQPVAQTAAAAEPTLSVLAKLGQRVSPLADRAVTATGPGGAKAILMLSGPLANKSPEVRNAVGWVALWTMFLAVVVWGYALLFSTSSPPTPTQAPSRMVEADPAPGVTLSHEP